MFGANQRIYWQTVGIEKKPTPPLSCARPAPTHMRRSEPHTIAGKVAVANIWPESHSTMWFESLMVRRRSRWKWHSVIERFNGGRRFVEEWLRITLSQQATDVGID